MYPRQRELPLYTACVTLAAFALSGCGFIFTHGPPAQHAQLDYFSCTETNAGPIIDAIMAGLYGLGTIAIAADPDEYELTDSETTSAIIGGVFWTGLLTGGAVVGFNKTSRCREAKAQLATRTRPQQPAEQRDPRPTDAPNVLPPPDTDVILPPEPQPRGAARYVVPAGARASRTYSGPTGDDAVQAVLRGMTSAGFHTTPTRSDHACFAGFDGVRGDQTVTVYVCEIENPVSEELRWEITIISAFATVSTEVRAAIDDAGGSEPVPGLAANRDALAQATRVA